MRHRHDDVDIEATPGGGYDVGWAAPGEWLEYTVDVAAAGNYRLSFRAATPNPGASLSVSAGGADVTGSGAGPPTPDRTLFAGRARPSRPPRCAAARTAARRGASRSARGRAGSPRSGW